MDEFTTIYALCDPREPDPILRIRYVGMTAKPLALRFKWHLHDARRGDTDHRSNWIRSMPVPPVIEFLAAVHEDFGCETEIEFIAHYRSLGCRLTNLTDGGEWIPGYTHSLETRARMSAGHKGIRFSAEHRANMSAAMKGIRRSPESRERMRLAQQRRILSPEALARIIAGSKGRVATDAARAKMRAARLGKKRPLEVGAKISATLRARFLRLKEQRG